MTPFRPRDAEHDTMRVRLFGRQEFPPGGTVLSKKVISTSFCCANRNRTPDTPVCQPRSLSLGPLVGRGNYPDCFFILFQNWFEQKL